MINNELFKVKEFPKFIPDSSQYIDFWRTIKRRCIEGYWVGGKWMPGIVYQYINVWHIGLKEHAKAKSEIIARPFLRDLEWDKGYIYVEARGFSGFSLDEEYSCNEAIKNVVLTLEGKPSNPEDFTPNCFKPDGTLKQYIPARDYLRRIHSKALGKPLYENEAKNVVDIESRGGGKSYWASNMIAHNFLFDGATDYDEYYRRRQEEKEMLKSETLIGAVDYKYTADLIKKYWIGIDNLPGAQEYNKRKYNSPLFVEYTGSLATGSTITAQREVKIGNNWVTKGSKSMIHNRSFGDNDFAASGTRPNLILLEEVGFMGNLLGALGTIKDTQMNGSYKMGTTWMFGTGGDMDGGTTEAVKEVFYNPSEYDCLVFHDEWEDTGDIGLFIPAHMTLNDCKDRETGETDKEKAKAIIQKNRDAKKSNPKAYIKELENRPEKPSEAFMTSDDNMFPIQDCKDRLALLETDKRLLNSVWIGQLKLDEGGLVTFKVSDRQPIYNFPLRADEKTGDLTGAIQIFEMPYETNGRPPKGLYLAGLDPYDDDTGTSLGSMFILNSITRRIVAEYTGRPHKAEEFYETCRRMLIFYNADCNYENNKKGFFGYMDKKNSLQYLADTPKILRDVENTTFHESGNKSKGFNATQAVNQYNRQLYKHWLLEDIYTQDDFETLPNNASLIKSPALLKETIAWNIKGNFDRISAIGAALLLLEDRSKRIIELDEEDNSAISDDFFSRHYNN